MGAIGEMTLEEAAREAAGNWKSWTCFVWDREPDIDASENWSIIYTHNRDSGLLAQSNAAMIAEALMSFSETMNPDVVFESRAHWAVGHVDGFSIWVYRDGEITEAFHTYHSCCANAGKTAARPNANSNESQRQLMNSPLRESLQRVAGRRLDRANLRRFCYNCQDF